MALVPAICTQCGGKITVDDTHDAGVCEFCGTAFITEKVINNYQNTININSATINVAGVDIDNLLLRAKSFEESGNYEKAIEYYNKVLDIDISNAGALEGIKRISNICYIGLKPVSQSVCAEIDSLLEQGRKVDAIKRVREETGYGLGEAKYIVDNHNIGVWGKCDVDTIFNQMTQDYQKQLTSEKPSSKSGCYVATAVYGSYDCPEVWTLRRYRDYTLAETWYGRAFIQTYYAVSPSLVKWFGKTEWFRNLWKPALDRMVSRLNSNGTENTPYQDKKW